MKKQKLLEQTKEIQREKAKSKTKHLFSDLLRSDSRKDTPAVVVQKIGELTVDGAQYLIFTKIYGTLDSPGSELITLACINSTTGEEKEFRFDERYPVSIHFKKQDHKQKVSYVETQLSRAGGFEKLLKHIPTCR